MGFGCNACGVTGCRIIDSPRERLIAILTNSFAPCNGRFPLLIFLCAVFFDAGSAGGALLLTGAIAGASPAHACSLPAALSLLSARSALLVRAGASALPRAAAGQGRSCGQRARPHGVRARPRDDCCGACRCAHLAARKHHSQRQLPVRQHDCLSRSVWALLRSARSHSGGLSAWLPGKRARHAAHRPRSSLRGYTRRCLRPALFSRPSACKRLDRAAPHVAHSCSPSATGRARSTCLTVFRETRSVRDAVSRSDLLRARACAHSCGCSVCCCKSTPSVIEKSIRRVFYVIPVQMQPV